MRARPAFVGALVTLLASTVAPAGTAETLVVEPPASEWPNTDLPPKIGLITGTLGPAVPAVDPFDSEPIPYRFECEIVEQVGGREIRYTKLLEGVLEDEPVHFEIDGYRITDAAGSDSKGYACTYEIGSGDEDPAPDSRPRRLDPWAPVMGIASHGHAIHEDDEGRMMGVAGARYGLPGRIRPGTLVRWTHDFQPDEPEHPREHAAHCTGLTLARGLRSFETAGTWCEHEEPGANWRRTPGDRLPDVHDDGSVEPADLVESATEPLPEAVTDAVTDAVASLPDGDLPQAPEPPAMPDAGATLPPVEVVGPRVDLSFEPERRFELLTCRLRGGCSAPELLRQAAVGPV